MTTKCNTSAWIVYPGLGKKRDIVVMAKFVWHFYDGVAIVDFLQWIVTLYLYKKVALFFWEVKIELFRNNTTSSLQLFLKWFRKRLITHNGQKVMKTVVTSTTGAPWQERFKSLILLFWQLFPKYEIISK